MTWWPDIAESRPGTPNHGGPAVEQRGVVEHIAEGSYEGTISWCLNPDSNVSCHFVVAKDGRATQMLDTDVTCWAQIDGNGHWIAVENEGFSTDYLTDAQISKNAEILARYVQEYQVPCQVATSPAGYGLGHHSMGAENGYNWGHSQCPGSNIKSQKQSIVDLANDILSGGTVPITDQDVQRIAAAVWTNLVDDPELGPNQAGQLLTYAPKTWNLVQYACIPYLEQLLALAGGGPGTQQAVTRGELAAALRALADRIAHHHPPQTVNAVAAPTRLGGRNERGMSW